MNELRTMHLFAGIGGGLLADLILGHRPIIAVEWEPYACRVLRERAADGWFPDLRVWEGDVRLFDPSEYTGGVDCIHAGFPCQDISVAGKGAGVSEGTRSGLYREVLRIAGVVRPRYLFLENVSAILSNGLGTVLADLAAMGYDTRWMCIRASDVGAPHHRDRWFCLARHTDSGNVGAQSGVCQGEEAITSGSSANGVPNANNDRCGNGPIQHISGQLESSPNVGNDGKEGYVADTKSDRRDSAALQKDDGEKVLREGGCRPDHRSKNEDVADTESAGEGAGRSGSYCVCGSRISPTDNPKWENAGQIDIRHNTKHCGCCNAVLSDTSSARLERYRHIGVGIESPYATAGDSCWWTTEPELGRVAHGIPNRVGQLKGYGNAQVPLQAAAAWRLLGGC